MCCGHQERPDDEAGGTGCHADAHPMPMPVSKLVHGPGNEQSAAADADEMAIDDQARRKHERCHDAYRQCVTQRHRRDGEKDCLPAVTMQAERDREQPAHRGVEPVKHPQPRNGKPFPCVARRGRCHIHDARVVSAALPPPVTDNSTSPMNNRRPRAAPDAAGAWTATRPGSADRTQCRPRATHRASPSSP